jgi:signal transduction histidine kinase/ActR/RegA family two-component response regulator
MPLALELDQVLALRRKGLRLRVGIAAAISLGFLFFTDWRLCLGWGLAYGLLQLAEDRWSGRLPPWAALALLSLSSFTFGAFALTGTLKYGGWGVAAGMGLIYGAFFNTAMNSLTSKAAFLASFTPFALLSAVLPLVAASSRELKEVILMELAGGYVSMMAYMIWKKGAEAFHAEEDARARAEAAHRAKSSFLATMSHEIRTPLNGVLGMAQAMAADDLSPAQRERINVIRQSGKSLLAILNDILDMAKVEAGKLELEILDFDLAEMVHGAHATFAAEAKAKGLAFSSNISPAAHGLFRGDPTRLRQVIYNLISNALKFTEQGQVSLAVEWTDDTLSVAVSDSGIGIAPEAMEGLFSRFNQADTTTTRRFGGTGLGLAICRHLGQLMGGDLEAKSAPGEGSTFTLRLPLARVGEARSPAAQDIDPRKAAVEDGRRLRILAAEDNAVNRLVLKTLVGQMGSDITVVENGAEAIDAWREATWDVILMDVQMPVMDGMTAARAIRAAEVAEGRARTAIIALTANAMIHQVAQYTACGMDAHVAKPIDVLLLFQTIEAVVEPSPSEVPAAASG